MIGLVDEPHAVAVDDRGTLQEITNGQRYPHGSPLFGLGVVQWPRPLLQTLRGENLQAHGVQGLAFNAKPFLIVLRPPTWAAGQNVAGFLVYSTCRTALPAAVHES